jgi:glycosyltransferase involved in cell wall biosynthesis
MNKPQSKFDHRIHILFFVPTLGGGGAEMHLLRIINHLDPQKFRFSLALSRSGGSYESNLPKYVKLHFLNTGKTNSSVIRNIRSIAPLRQLIQDQKPNILCSIMDHANVVAVLAASTLPTRPKVILCVQNPPTVEHQPYWHITNLLTLSLIPRLYPQADQIIALSQGVAEDLMTLCPHISNQLDVIYNAGWDSRVLSGAEESIHQEDLPANVPLIVACGRLTDQKGFPYLIDALAQVRQVIPVHLWIIGEGKQRGMLEKQIQQLGLNDCVRLLGFQSNPYKYMAAADIFVLSSLYEGFGNVIVEAMACGTPVIATDCPYGPGEIIENGVNGILVPPANVEAIAEAVIRLLTTDSELKLKFSENGKSRSQQFHAQVIASIYEKMFLRNSCIN